MSGSTPNLAVFADYENVALGARDDGLGAFRVDVVLERLLDKGQVIVKRAYADWTRYAKSRRPLHEAGFELVEVPHVSYGGKNSADIRLVVDAMDLAHKNPHVGMFAVVSGDSDFSPLVGKLRENGKTVVGIGVRGSTSRLLVEACDEFLFYDDLVRTPRPERAGGDDTAPVDDKRAAMDLVVHTADALLRDRGEAVWGSHVKQVLKRKRPEFDERTCGHRAWGDVLDELAAAGRLEIAQDAASGGCRILRVA